MKRLLSRAPGGRMLVLPLTLVLALPGTGLAARGGIQNHLLSIKLSFEHTDYERALDLVRVARQEPHDTDEDVTLSLYECILQYELRQKDEARAACRSAFLLNPQAELPVPVKNLSPKVQKPVEADRQEAKAELAAMPRPPTRPEDVKPSPDAQATDTEDPAPSPLRQHALIPTLAGGALLVAGGISLGVARAQYNKLDTDDPRIISYADVQLIAQRGRTWNAVGLGLIGVGAAGVLTGAGMYLFGGPRDASPAVGLSTDGTSAILYGRWP